nr:diguanylate cyclase [uncultured Lichenicoccus sp.]
MTVPLEIGRLILVCIEISIGVTHANDDIKSIDALLTEADTALYRAKQF